MEFAYNERKAAHAAAHLLRLHGGTPNYTSLIKFLYLADRKALLGSGIPITRSSLCSMDQGMVLSDVYDSIRFAAEGQPWRQFISAPEGYAVSLCDTTSALDELSEYDIQVLNEINSQFGNWTWQRLAKYTHDLPEYEDPKGSSLTIDHEKILSKENVPDEYIKEIADNVEAQRIAQRLGPA